MHGDELYDDIGWYLMRSIWSDHIGTDKITTNHTPLNSQEMGSRPKPFRKSRRWRMENWHTLGILDLPGALMLLMLPRDRPAPSSFVARETVNGESWGLGPTNRVRFLPQISESKDLRKALHLLNRSTKSGWTGLDPGSGHCKGYQPGRWDCQRIFCT